MTVRAQLWAGDALEIGEHVGRRRFELVYVDPPYAVGKVHRARSGRGARATGVRGYDDSWGGVVGLLAMLEPRLAVCRDLLTPEGTLWLHLDQRSVHEAKCLCDRVFGRAAFRGEIIWEPGNGARGRGVPATHQTLLVYSRSTRAGLSYRFRSDDPALREPYAATSREMHFRHSDAAGRRYRERVIGGKTYRYYEDQGRRRGSVWSDLPAMRANTPLRSETTGYPTQKPLALLDRVVRAASEPGAWVLDPMCGSGTTLHAALAAGRNAVGNDSSPLALRLARERLGALGFDV